MSGYAFPEDFLANAHEAPFHERLVTAALTGGPGSTIVYDTRLCRFAAAEAAAPMPAEPDQVTVAAHADLAETVQEALGGGMDISGAAEKVRARALEHLAAWADTERLASMAPVLKTRAALGSFGLRAARRSTPVEGSACDHFLRPDAPHVTVSVAYPPPGRPEPRLGIHLRDLGAHVQAWTADFSYAGAGTAAQDIARALARYLGE
ncbi:hypothetical protein [Nocardiopsis chromatogenes]|uniref:hypothetical protein n=1 Tax=Nocardiopsis chromatogenes TaxID=280239 RepID=UPI00034A97EE|nr:hypothetical protein [Nocardiopsis chromatogenes]